MLNGAALPHRSTIAHDAFSSRYFTAFSMTGILNGYNEQSPLSLKSKATHMTLTIPAEPYDFTFDPAATALLIIDMQRDFVDSGGFGELLGNDVAPLREVIAPIGRVLAAWRARGLLAIHTREGHRPDLSDCPPAKLARGKLEIGIGDQGPLGRVLVRGEWGHDIVGELRPLPNEPVIDKPGKGSFYATDLELILRRRGITHLVLTGITTDVCVHTTMRDA